MLLNPQLGGGWGGREVELVGGAGRGLASIVCPLLCDGRTLQRCLGLTCDHRRRTADLRTHPLSGYGGGGGGDDSCMLPVSPAAPADRELGVIQWGTAQAKGMRPYMEDRHTVVAAFQPRSATGQPLAAGDGGVLRAYASVFDGHNGAAAAEHAAKRLHHVLAAEPTLRTCTGKGEGEGREAGEGGGTSWWVQGLCVALERLIDRTRAGSCTAAECHFSDPDPRFRRPTCSCHPRRGPAGIGGGRGGPPGGGAGAFV